MSETLIIDGSRGEGGGQILRSSLALSMITGRPIQIDNIRARRSRPGLQRQHLTAVLAAAKVSQARVDGAFVGSGQLWFTPAAVVPGRYEFDIGTAGSTTLVVQTILPALLTAGEPSSIRLGGGTHNVHAPPFEFVSRAFAPLVSRMGPNVEVYLARHGFYPAGGGQIDVEIQPAAKLEPLHLTARGEIRRRSALVVITGLDRQIAERELQVVRKRLAWPEGELEILELSSGRGPGNVITLEIESEHVTEVFSGFGQRGIRAEAVAKGVVDEVEQYLAANVPVGPHLADQLLLPLALAGSGSFLTLGLSSHAETNIETIQMFLDVQISTTPSAGGNVLVHVGP